MAFAANPLFNSLNILSSFSSSGSGSSLSLLSDCSGSLEDCLNLTTGIGFLGLGDLSRDFSTFTFDLGKSTELRDSDVLL